MTASHHLPPSSRPPVTAPRPLPLVTVAANGRGFTFLLVPWLLNSHSCLARVCHWWRSGGGRGRNVQNVGVVLKRRSRVCWAFWINKWILIVRLSVVREVVGQCVGRARAPSLDPRRRLIQAAARPPAAVPLCCAAGVSRVRTEPTHPPSLPAATTITTW